MRAEYIGDNDSIDFYGINFKRGEAKEISSDKVAYMRKRFMPGNKTKTNPVFVADKIAGHPDFKVVAEQVEAPKRRGRPKKVLTDGGN